MIGQTISRYKIIEKLGEGGMGVVYKARDTKLKRPVALKFLRSEVLADEEHRERFLREAQAAAALDHPNICTVYEIDEADGQTFLSMAYLEGETVKDKTKARPLKLEEALEVAIQTAEGLRAAHEKGIVHRDIKSANLMVMDRGQVKIMDFGLALVADRSHLTKNASMLGTPAYMSPEQVRRQPTDRRTDIWSLGVVIYEMLTGRVPFEAERAPAVLYAITEQAPEPITALRAGVPMELERIVGKALAKDRDERYPQVEDLLVDLRGLRQRRESEDSSSHRGPAGPTESRAVEEGRRHVPRLWKTAATIWAATTVSLAALWFLGPRPGGNVSPTRLALPVNEPVAQAVISPDGRSMAYLTTNGVLKVRDLDKDGAREIAGPGISTPFTARVYWSPDSKSITFQQRDELKTVPAAGGRVATICKLPGQYLEGSWSPGGDSIIFGARPAIYEVSAQGGEPRILVEPWDEKRPYLSFPRTLPSRSGRKLLYTAFSAGPNDAQVIAHDLVSGRREVVTDGDGYLLDSGIGK